MACLQCMARSTDFKTFVRCNILYTYLCILYIQYYCTYLIFVPSSSISLIYWNYKYWKYIKLYGSCTVIWNTVPPRYDISNFYPLHLPFFAPPDYLVGSVEAVEAVDLWVTFHSLCQVSIISVFFWTHREMDRLTSSLCSLSVWNQEICNSHSASLPWFSLRCGSSCIKVRNIKQNHFLE